MDFCEIRPELFVASGKLLPSLTAVCSNLPSASAAMNVCLVDETRRSFFQADNWSLKHSLSENKDQRGSSQSGPTDFTFLHNNFPATSRALAVYMPFLDCFFTCLCIHDCFSSVFQHQFHALPASVATFYRTSTTIRPRHAQPIPTHCSYPQRRR